MSDPMEATVTPSLPSTGPAPDEALPVSDPNRYLIERELGQGGQSIVFAVRDSALGREVALKTAKQQGAAAAGFVREARITGQLEHPGIVPVHELGRSSRGEYYCTQKLVRGRTFREALEQAKTLEQRLALLPHFVDLCHAVAYAHSRGVVHRDLKPENVMVGEFGETVVLDWGVARVLGSPESQPALEKTPRRIDGIGAGSTMRGSIVGTPLYMSPEQARGDGEKVDARSDVWSLGVMLYELIAFARPFDDTDVQRLIGQVARAELRPLRDLAPDAPPELAAIVDGALQLDPARRFGDARQLAKQIADFHAGKRVASYSYSSMELIRRFISRNRALTAVSVALVVSLVISEMVAWNLLGKSELAEKSARKNLASSLGERARAEERFRNWGPAFNAYANAAAVEPDVGWEVAAAAMRPWAVRARRLPGESTRAHSGWGGLDLDADRAVLNFFKAGAETIDSSGRWTPLGTDSNPGKPWQAVAISAGGRRWAVASSTVKVFDEGGPAREVEQTSEAEALKFSGDGAWLVVAGKGFVRVFDAHTLELRRELLPAFASPSVVGVNRRSTAVAVEDEDGTLRWWMEDGAAPRTALVKNRPYVSLAFSADDQWLFAGDDEYRIQVFDTKTGGLAHSLVGHTRTISALAVSPSGGLLASASLDKSLLLWHVPSWKPLARLTCDCDELRGLAFSADGTRVGALDRLGRRFDWDIAPLAASLPFGDLSEWAVELAPAQGAGLWVRTRDSLMRFDGQHALKFSERIGKPGALLVVEGGALVGREGVLELRAAQDGTVVKAVKPCQATVTSLAQGPDGKTLWAACGSQVLALSAQTLEPIGPPLASRVAVRRLAFSADGKRLAWVADDGAGQLWALEPRKKLGEWTSGYREAIAFSPDGQWLALAGAEGLAIRDGRTARPVRQLRTDDLRMRRVGFAFGGRALWLAGLNDLSLWDVATGRLLVELPGLHHEVTAAVSTAGGEGLWIGDAKKQLFEYRF